MFLSISSWFLFIVENFFIVYEEVYGYVYVYGYVTVCFSINLLMDIYVF